MPSGGAWTLGRTYVSSLNLNSSTPNMIFNGITFDSAGNLYGTSKVAQMSGHTASEGKPITAVGRFICWSQPGQGGTRTSSTLLRTERMASIRWQDWLPTRRVISMVRRPLMEQEVVEWFFSCHHQALAGPTI